MESYIEATYPNLHQVSVELQTWVGGLVLLKVVATCCVATLVCTPFRFNPYIMMLVSE